VHAEQPGGHGADRCSLAFRCGLLRDCLAGATGPDVAPVDADGEGLLVGGRGGLAGWGGRLVRLLSLDGEHPPVTGRRRLGHTGALVGVLMTREGSLELGAEIGTLQRALPGLQVEPPDP
jgi:hypothetical protein